MIAGNANRQRIRTLGGSLIIALALAVVAGPAEAGAIFDNATDCFSRTTNGGMTENDLVNNAINGPQSGNFWARSDTFTLGECSGFTISGVSVIVKTPFDITPNPDIDDIDTGADVSALGDQLDDDFPEFGHHTANAIVEAGGQSPSDFGGFHSVAGCAVDGGSAGSANDIAGCMNVGPTVLTDLDGMGMRYGISFGDDPFFFDYEEGETQFTIVTIIYSDVFGEQVGNDIPEVVIGWQFVPEPTPLALLAPGFLAWAIARRKARR